MKMSSALLALFILGIFYCSDPKNNEGNSTTQTEEISWNAAETVTLSPSNLTIEQNDIKLTFDADQITENFDVKIYQGSGSNSFYEQAETDIMGIEFLTEPDENLEVQVALNLSNTNEKTIYLGFNDRAKSNSLRSDIVYSVNGVNQEGETLTATVTLPFSDISSLETGTRLNKQMDGGYLFGLFGGKEPERDSTTHFILEKPASNSASLSTYLGYLEEAYSKLNSLGFPMDSISTAAGGKIKCFIGNTGKNSQDESNLGMYYMISNHIYITDDETALSGANSADVKATLGHEFFHYVQYNWFISRVSLSDSYSWLAEASAVWFEYQIDSPDRYIDVAITNADFFKDGVEGKTADDIDNHGYGASYFLKHLSDTRGNQIIAEIWNQVKAQSFGQRVSSRAIDQCLENYDTWMGIKSSTDYEMGEFIEDYIQDAIKGEGEVNFGNLYPDENKFFVRDTNTTEYSSTFSYPDLSSQVYYCWLPSTVKNQFSFEDGIDFVIDFSDLTSLFRCFVFDANSGALLSSDLASASPITVPDFQTHDKLAVVVHYSNHALYYDSQKSQGVNFSLSFDNLLNKLHTTNEIEFVIGGDHRGSEGRFCCYSDLQPELGRLTWSNRSFSASYDTTDSWESGTYTVNESFTGNVSSDGKKIESVTYSFSSNGESYSKIGDKSYRRTTQKNISITMTDIDHNTKNYYNNEHQVQYYIEGAECANHITISYQYECNDEDPTMPSGTETYSHTNWDSEDDYPRVFIIFREDD